MSANTEPPSASADYPLPRPIKPELADVLAFPPRGTEIINGVAMRLGSMSLETLLGIEAGCRERLAEAQTDLMIVQDVREGRFPDAPEAA